MRLFSPTYSAASMKLTTVKDLANVQEGRSLVLDSRGDGPF